MATDLTVAKTIQAQLGGALMMMGARNLVGDSKSLMFSIMRGAKNGINKIRITLEPSDTYKVEFIKLGRAPRYDVTTVSTHDDIYVENLHDLIERETGLAVRVPRIRGINC